MSRACSASTSTIWLQISGTLDFKSLSQSTISVKYHRGLKMRLTWQTWEIHFIVHWKSLNSWSTHFPKNLVMLEHQWMTTVCRLVIYFRLFATQSNSPCIGLKFCHPFKEKRKTCQGSSWKRRSGSKFRVKILGMWDKWPENVSIRGTRSRPWSIWTQNGFGVLLLLLMDRLKSSEEWRASDILEIHRKFRMGSHYLARLFTIPNSWQTSWNQGSFSRYFLGIWQGFPPRSLLNFFLKVSVDQQKSFFVLLVVFNKWLYETIRDLPTSKSIQEFLRLQFVQDI